MLPAFSMLTLLGHFRRAAIRSNVKTCATSARLERILLDQLLAEGGEVAQSALDILFAKFRRSLRRVSQGTIACQAIEAVRNAHVEPLGRLTEPGLEFGDIARSQRVMLDDLRYELHRT